MNRPSASSEERERVVYEFDGFRADPVRRLLSRHGEPVAITPKALSILLVLLERPGEVVEKKALIDRIWPGVFVSDANLTQNVFSLRKSLGDRATDTRYIVTVPGEGYTFVGDVRRVERASTSEFPIVVDAPPAAPEVASRAELVAPAPEPLSSPRRSPWLRVSVVLIGLLAAGAALFGLLQMARRSRSPETTAAVIPVRPAIAVLDFKSLSPRAEKRWLDTAFAEMLTTELAAGGSLRAIRGETVAQAWRSLALRDPVSLGRAELQRLHESLGADFVVVGSYLPIGGKIRLDLRVLQSPGGDTVASFSEVGTEPGLFDLVKRTGLRLRDSFGLARLSPQQVRETKALHPSNPEARQLYLQGLGRLHAFDPPGALDFLQRAVAADPGSAVIHSGLSQAWSALGYDSRAVAEAGRARALGGSLPREERLAIEGRLYKAAKDWEKASQTYRSLWTFFPDDVEYGLQLAESLLAGGRGEEAASALAALRKLKPPAGEDPRIDLLEARNAWRLGDFATMKGAAERAAAKGGRSGRDLVVAQGLVYEGNALGKMGQTPQAVQLYRQAAALCGKAGYQWGVGMALSNVGIGLQALGDLDGAERAHEESLDIARRLGSALGMVSQLYNLGQLHWDRGELAEALALQEQSREWSVRMADRWLEARALNAAGTVLRAQGDLAAARQRLERALSLSQSLGNPTGEALALDNLGGVLAAQGELAEARRRHGEAFAVLRRGGDSSLAASALAALADAAARLGEVGPAWQQSAQALATKQRAGDRIGAGRILGSRAWLAYEMGDLGASRAIAEEQLRIARETGARFLTAWALQNRGRVELAAGDLTAARQSLTESLQVSSVLGDDLRAMEARLALAELALAAGRAGEAARLAREAAAWYGSHRIPSEEIEALSLLAEALWRQGRREEAEKLATSTHLRLESSEDRVLRATAAARLARVEAATGHPEEALQWLRHAAEDAARSGLAAAGLEARLALAEVMRGLRDPAAGAALAAVRKEAQERGFKRLAASAGLPSLAAPRLPLS